MVKIMGKYCDSRCINAVSDVCTCSCGGVNHGVGRHLIAVIEPKPLDLVKLAESKALAEKIRIWLSKGG